MGELKDIIKSLNRLTEAIEGKAITLSSDEERRLTEIEDSLCNTLKLERKESGRLVFRYDAPNHFKNRGWLGKEETVNYLKGQGVSEEQAHLILKEEIRTGKMQHFDSVGTHLGEEYIVNYRIVGRVGTSDGSYKYRWFISKDYFTFVKRGETRRRPFKSEP